MIRRSTLAAAAALLTGACSDPAGPCDGGFACEVAGVDLAIVDARIIGGDRIGTDHITGLPIYAAGPVSVAFTIVNRGDSTSMPQPLDKPDELLPPLRPGESTEVVVTEDYTNALHFEPYWATLTDPRTADQRRLLQVLRQRPPGDPSAPEEWPVQDQDTSNNVMYSPAFHVAMPVLRATFAEIDEIRANTPFVTSFRVENLSVHGGNAAAFDVVLCAAGCYGGWWSYFGRFEVPGVDAGWKYENAYVAEVGPQAMDRPDQAHPALLVLCIVPPDHNIPHPAFETDCTTLASAATHFMPDYESCDPPLLQPGIALTIPAPNCGDLERQGRAFIVAAFDAIAGRSYTIDGRFVTVRDADGQPADLPGEGFSVAESGRYYVLARFTFPATITVTEQ